MIVSELPVEDAPWTEALALHALIEGARGVPRHSMTAARDVPI